MNEKAMADTDGSFPPHELTSVGLLLAFVGGFLDAHTYIARGGVFANAQTGNIVMLGISFCQMNFAKSLYYLTPIFAFTFGIFITEILKRRFSDRRFITWIDVSLITETMILIILAFLPIEIPNEIVNVTISFVCSMQVNSFRRIKGAAFSTTMCTGNLRSGCESLYLFLSERDSEAGARAGRYFLVVGVFILGAGAGAYLTGIMSNTALLVCCVINIITLTLLITYNAKRG